MSPARRGSFVVLEGLDGAGTTTQAGRLSKRLQEQGVPAHVTAQPSSGPIGVQIRQILAGRLVGRGAGGAAAPFDRRALALLFAADRLDHLQAVIDPGVLAGQVVVCDRYLLSSLAYQGLDARPAWIAELNRLARAPDLTLFLRVRPEVALRRRLSATPGAAEIFETLPLQRRVARNYERDVAARGRQQRVKILDGEQSPDEVAAAIWVEVAKLLARR